LKKTYNNQEFNTKDMFLVLFLIGAIALIFVGIVGNSLEDPTSRKAQRDVEALIGQVMGWNQSGFVDQSRAGDLQTGEGQREMASLAAQFPLGKEGVIGVDPWGQAYRFQIVEIKNPHAAYVLVWSNGPNARNDSEDGLNLNRLYQGNPKVVFRGDDLGYFKRIY
jgi:hypothetical protein